MHNETLGVDAEFDALAYSYEKPRAANDNAVIGERNLWCSVIEQAFVDAGFIIASRGTERNKECAKANVQDRDDAIRWLLRDKRDFVCVCLLAGVSPSVIRRAAQILSSI